MRKPKPAKLAQELRRTARDMRHGARPGEHAWADRMEQAAETIEELLWERDQRGQAKVPPEPGL